MLKRKQAASSGVCALAGETADACGALGDGILPICDKHLAALNRKITESRIPEHMRQEIRDKAGEALLFNRGNGDVFALNATGIFILKAVMAGEDVSVILSGLRETFAVDSVPEAIRHLNAFLGELLALDFMQA